MGLTVAAIALTGCVAQPGPPGYAAGPRPVSSTEPAAKIALLLPLTGSNAELGRSMLRAAQVALDAPDSPTLDVRDTAGTPAGAAAAVRAALAAGAAMVIGPLTTGETQAVAPLTRAANVPVLAFTSDVAQAQPGVWTLGITPAQQVRRLVGAVQEEGRGRIAAVLPQNPFGDALAAGLQDATGGLAAPRVVRYGATAALSRSLAEVAEVATRQAAVDPAIIPDPATPAMPPAVLPFDTLLLGATGASLAQALPLTKYDITAAAPSAAGVRVLGPGLWAREASRLGALTGAWYAAPDPAARSAFTKAYTAKFGSGPRELSSLAFDAASIARLVAQQGFAPDSLMRPEGFTGADGLMVLGANGQVRRGLAVFEIDRAGSRIVRPAPTSASAPGT